MTILQKLTTENRLLEVLYDNCSDDMKESEVYAQTAAYLQSYLSFQDLTTIELANIYSEFISHYNKHCKAFIKTGSYPSALGSKDYNPTRVEYDLLLLMSVLFTAHRFQIMKLIKSCDVAGKALYIGIGPGLELLHTQSKHDEMHAYDLTINSFLQNKFPTVHFFQDLYCGQQKDYFDTIYLIELLEHLEDPYALIEICYRSLIKEGKLILTTASDLPQFDHLFNFSKDHIEFEKRVKTIGFSISKKETIDQQHLAIKIQPTNTFYILSK